MNVRNVPQRFPGSDASEPFAHGGDQADQTYLGDLEERLTSEREYNASLAQRLRAMQNQLIAARRQAEESETSTTAAKRALQSVLDERNALETQLEALEADRASDVERVRAATLRAREASGQIAEMRVRIREFERGFGLENERVQTLRAAALAGRAAQGRLQIAHHEIQRLNQSAEALQRELSARQAELERAQAAHAFERDWTAALQGELEAAAALEIKLREELAQMQQLARVHAAARTAVATRLAPAERANAELSEALAGAQAQLNALTRQHNDLVRAQIDAADREIAALTDMSGIIRTSRFWKLKTAITGSRKRKLAAVAAVVFFVAAIAGVVTLYFLHLIPVPFR